MKTRLLSISTAIALLVSLFGSTAFAQGPDLTPRVIPIHPISPHYAAIKAAIDAHAGKGSGKGGGGSGGGSSGGGSTIGASWLGLGPSGYSPSDATGAIGPNSYIEMINSTVGVFSRSGSLLSSSSEASFTDNPNAGGDGQILWDPGTNRFYYAILSVSATNQYGLIYGFSKGNNPSASSSDWCTYASDFGAYGTDLPDYPKLGTTSEYILIGVNRFAGGNTFAGADVAWATKPPAGTNTSPCPSLDSGVVQNLKNADGSDASTPVVARQTDESSAGYVVANEDPGDATSNVLSVFSVNPGSSGPVITFDKTITVDTYSYPPSAPQPKTSDLLDTMDARLTNAWLAPDPNHSNAPAIWTQHTVASSGGTGSEVRWYEIDPSTGDLFQHGVANSSSQYVFDGAISPDRVAPNATYPSGAFGGNMVLGFNTSSSNSYPTLQMVSKVGLKAQTGFVKVAQSTRSDTEFTCNNTDRTCRWGDYAGASPDPNPSTTTEGQVWLTGMLSNGGNFLTNAWKTWNWQATP